MIGLASCLFLKIRFVQMYRKPNKPGGEDWDLTISINSNWIKGWLALRVVRAPSHSSWRGMMGTQASGKPSAPSNAHQSKTVISSDVLLFKSTPSWRGWAIEIRKSEATYALAASTELSWLHRPWEVVLKASLWPGLFVEERVLSWLP